MKPSTILATLAIAFVLATTAPAATEPTGTKPAAPTNVQPASAPACSHATCSIEISRLNGRISYFENALGEAKTLSEQRLNQWFEEYSGANDLRKQVKDLTATTAKLEPALANAKQEIIGLRALVSMREQWLVAKERELQLWRSGVSDPTPRQMTVSPVAGTKTAEVPAK